MEDVPTKQPAPVWTRLPAFPVAPGRAGAITGSHGGVLIAGGGANFPDRPPWEGGVKRYYDDLHVLLPGAGAWRPAGRLAQPRGYAACVSTPEGVLVIGGENAEGLRDDCLLLTWERDQLSIRPGPRAPGPLASAAAAVLGGAVYLAGGYGPGAQRPARREFWKLALGAPAAGWTALEPWPGPARALAVAASAADAFYLISGLQPAANDRPALYLSDAYRYRPGSGWETLPPPPRAVVAAPTPAPVAGDRIHLFGGVDGTQAGRPPPEVRLPAEIVGFDLSAGTWAPVPGAWPMPVVTVTAAIWNGAWTFVSGESRPGHRTTDVWQWRI